VLIERPESCKRRWSVKSEEVHGGESGDVIRYWVGHPAIMNVRSHVDTLPRFIYKDYSVYF